MLILLKPPLLVRLCKTKYMRTWHTYILWNIKIQTGMAFILQGTHTHCVPCMHAHMHTNILEPNSLHSTLPQHHCMHSKINWAEINCLITCQYGQKYVDHAQLRTPADTLSFWYTLSSRGTFRHTPSARHRKLNKKIHAQLSKRAT